MLINTCFTVFRKHLQSICDYYCAEFSLSMKKVFTVLLLLISIIAYSQADKDSLLIADKEAVLDKLELMFYLDKVSMEYCTMPGDAYRIESDKTFPYYFINTIVKNNPSSIDLKEFIGFDFKEFKPIKWKDFLEAVYEKNIAEFVALTEKYGYISPERLNRSKGGKAYGLVAFIVRTDSHDREVKRLIRREKKNGNMPQKDYDHFKFFLERKKILTKEDIARLEKKGTKMIFQERKPVN